MSIRNLCLAAVFLWVAATCITSAQRPRLPFGDLGYLDADNTQLNWPAPDSVAADLRSPDDQTRLKGLLLLGLTPDQAKITAYDQKTGKQIPGKQVVPVETVQLTYARLGTDDTMDAILAIQYVQSDFAAVAVPSGKGWTRVATLQCWCKYDLNPPLGQFLQLHPFPDNAIWAPHYELATRASGGGSGIYVQYEARFRIHQDQLRLTISFVSKRRSCPEAPPVPCTIQQHWVLPQWIDHSPGAALVERNQTFPLDGSAIPDVEALIPELTPQPQGKLTCKSYKWDEAAFRYRFIPGTPQMCRPPAHH